MEASSAEVSIIMAAYNAEKTIGQAIQSVIDQTYINWELLVINDCSTDNTVIVVNSFSDSRIRILNNPKQLGVSKTRKAGLEKANGEWIAVLDSDDAWLPDKLEKQIKLARDTGAELLFTGSAFMDDCGNLIDWQLHVPAMLSFHDLLKQNLISNSSVLVKSDLYRKYYAIGDEMHEDFAIWLEITKEGKIAHGIDEPLLVYRLTQSSKSSNKVKAAMMNWNTYRFIGLGPVTAVYYMCWYIVRSLLKYRHLIG